MATMNIFSAENKAWDTTELTGLINNKPSLPSMIGSMGLFTPKPIRSKNFFIDTVDGVLKLVGFSERGGDLGQHTRGTRKMTSLVVPKLGTTDKVWAHEVAGLRASGTETELMAVQSEVNDRLQGMKDDLAYSDEYLQLAAIQGKVLDPRDGSTYADAFTTMGVNAAANVVFELTSETANIKETCERLVIDVMRSAKGAWVQGQSKVIGLVEDDFWFALQANPEVKDWHRGHSAMITLMKLDPMSEFYYGGIIFKRYIGSDDNSEVALATGTAKFFVQGGRDIFVKAMAPADEHMSYVNTKGLPQYVIPKRDTEYAGNERWMGFDLVSYPLYWCQRPNTLRTGTFT